MSVWGGRSSAMSRKSGLEGRSPVHGVRGVHTPEPAGTSHPCSPVLTHIVGREGGAFLQLFYQPDAGGEEGFSSSTPPVTLDPPSTPGGV